LSLACVLESEQMVAQRSYALAFKKEMYYCATFFTGQAMFIDYRRSKIIQSVPLGINRRFLLDHAPTAEELAQMARQALLGGNAGPQAEESDRKSDFAQEFFEAAQKAPLRRKAGGAILVKPVALCPSAVRVLGAGEAESERKLSLYFAHRTASAMASMHQVSVVPCVADGATEKVRLRFADSSDIALSVERAAYEVGISVEGIARYQDPKHDQDVQDVIRYGAKGAFEIRGVLAEARPLVSETWRNGYAHPFLKGKAVADAEPYFYRTVIENALIEVVEKQLTAKHSKSSKEFEQIQSQCRL